MGIKKAAAFVLAVITMMCITIPVGAEKSKQSLAVGNYVSFGSYEQDNNASNGKEDIEWQVLDIKNGYAYLLSRYVLDISPEAIGNKYAPPASTLWKDLPVRKWLNDSFYNTAFSAKEKKAIKTKTVQNGIDNVTLLSPDEAEKYFNVREGGFGSEEPKAMCYATKYMASKTIFNGYFIDGVRLALSSWVTTEQKTVSEEGSWDFFDSGYYEQPMRPAIWVSVSAVKALPKIDISSLNIKKASNEYYDGFTFIPHVHISDVNKTKKEGKNGGFFAPDELIDGKDYTVSYKNNAEIGKATIVIKGQGLYTGTKKISFTIYPDKTTVASEISGNKCTLSWEPLDGVAGYQVYQSVDGGKFKQVKRTSKTQCEFSGLDIENKSYKYKVRGYKKVNGVMYCGKYSNVVTLSDTVKAGDYINFGTYEQDGNTDNGKEDIQWLVLEVKDGYALVISTKVLDAQAYNGDSSYTSWKDSTLRSWMNDDFYNAAFSAGEKKQISQTTITRGLYSYDEYTKRYFPLDVDINSMTKEQMNSCRGFEIEESTDKIFLLYSDMAEKYLTKETAIAKATEVLARESKEMSAGTYNNNKVKPGYTAIKLSGTVSLTISLQNRCLDYKTPSTAANWWLRDSWRPGTVGYMYCVDYNGDIPPNDDYDEADNSFDADKALGVRPAMRIKL